MIQILLVVVAVLITSISLTLLSRSRVSYWLACLPD